MLEWLAVSTGMGLGKLVLEQVLDLSKPVLEGYAQDFFGDCLESGVARLKFGTLKEPMAEAIGCFIKRFIEELQLNFVPETSIEHHYRGAIKRFVRDKAVGQILGKAFETECKQLDYAELERIWAEQYQESGWQFPAAEFDWRGVAKKYVFEVKGIVRANAELRALLETDLLETIAQNTAQVSPGFDIEAYRESLQYSYGYLKLYTLDSTDRVDAIKLWSIFVEQTVREALPPTRYELPLDLKRKLQEEGQLEEDLSPEALEHYRREYFEQPARKVLEAVAEAQRSVVLGDPGAGKSSLLQYLALEWVEGKTETLPLLIELREFAVSQCSNFLEFLHRGRGADWQFDQQQLHQHLLENPTLLMFDGLDEIFDRATQAAVVDDIVRFAQQYPQAKVLVTSRIIGYNPERLRHSGFRHFTIQSLDTGEIHEFIDHWYGLSMGSDPDKERLKHRLKDAIENSKAIQNLADNPLLLTMMAILNRRQELPRDRADLYDQASRVLLYHWDVDHKRLQLPWDAIGRREKQEILRLIAFEMQAGEGGLKGNFISAECLIKILTDYLRDQGFSDPRDKAAALIRQLRERNHILCYRGADTYSFLHRTFLEYFCAIEIVKQFETQRLGSFDNFWNRIFREHYLDKAWAEVLGLINLLIDDLYSAQIISKIIKYSYQPHAESELDNFDVFFFAAKLWFECKKTKSIRDIESLISKRLYEIILFKEGYSYQPYFSRESERIASAKNQAALLLIRCEFQDRTYLNLALNIISKNRDLFLISGISEERSKNKGKNFYLPSVRLADICRGIQGRELNPILIIDYDIAIRNLLKRLFEKWGFLVDTPDNDLLVEEAIQNKKYDLIMGQWAHGSEFASQVTKSCISPVSFKNEEIDARPWLLALTSRSDYAGIIGHGFDDYLRKPFNLTLVGQAILNSYNIKNDISQLITLKEVKEVSSSKFFDYLATCQNTGEKLAIVRAIFSHFSQDKNALTCLEDTFTREQDIGLKWVITKLFFEHSDSRERGFFLLEKFIRDHEFNNRPNELNWHDQLIYIDSEISEMCNENTDFTSELIIFIKNKSSLQLKSILLKALFGAEKASLRVRDWAKHQLEEL